MPNGQVSVGGVLILTDECRLGTPVRLQTGVGRCVTTRQAANPLNQVVVRRFGFRSTCLSPHPGQSRAQAQLLASSQQTRW